MNDCSYEPSDLALRVGQIMRREIVESEQRVCCHMDGCAVSFNNILMTGLGEVDAVYEVVLLYSVENYDPRVHGSKFPQKLLATNLDIDMFQVSISEFRGMELKTANNTLRDARRCLGCFSFPDEAGVDLPNLMVSLFKQGFLKRLVFSHVWHSKPNYLKSLKHSVKTFVAFLENDQRQHRAFGGLTTALGNLAGQLIVIMV